ncbi:MAG TPA: 2-hydroxychromene-2-carboxylate isomerase [Candidatus Polarisedimenticolia bacterium]|nr:2-hydroxychromene-2-carboxylate isomerase [Candidatus Polarisedimenticolia bacterium]
MEFWFDFASTYSYLASQRIESVAAARGVAIDWRPFLLGPLFQRQGWNDSPYNLNPARGRYMWRDLERQCARDGVPYLKPTVFPRRSILPARVACLGHGQAWLPPFARAVFQANFAEDRDIEDRELMLGLLLRSGAVADEASARALLDRATGQATKDLLRAETERAWSLGIFGAPTFVALGELFWGNDRLEEALDWHARG